MNKHLHRIVFNAARGLRMVVQETARGTGKGAAKATSGGTGALVSGAAIAAALMTAPLHAQIVADPGAPGRQRPTVLVAPNGVPLINIQTPSAAGVSRNTYSQFDVQRNGVVLNNSRGNVQTQLGGWVQGNPWLANGSARVILNEVNSANPSQLRGYVEVAGPRTEVIIANPAGIQVDGGGFINASRATLTTGTPQFNAQGALESFVVRGGNVSIDGAGLDAGKTDYAAILARAVQVNAGIWANDLKVATGANEVHADSGQATPTAGNSAAPAFALDVAALGGMYAGKITLVGTEAGVGVRNAGHIGAGAGGLVVTAAGRLENKGTLEGAKVELASATDIDNRGGTIRQAGTRELGITAPALSNTGGGVIGSEPVAAAPGTGAGGGGSTGTGGAGGTGGTTTGTATGTGAGTTTAAASANNQAASAAGIIEVTPAQPAAATGPGTISAAGTILNDGGSIYVGGELALNTPRIDNAGGTINVGSLAVSGPTFSNAGGTLNVARGFSAAVGSFDNSGGTLQAGNLDIAASGDLRNAGGTLVSAGDAKLAAGGLLDNTDGAVAATGSLNAAAGSISNSGTMRAGRDLGLTATGTLANSGTITAARHLAVTAGSLQGGSSGVLGAGIRSDGSLDAVGDLNVTTSQALVAHGLTLAAGSARLQGASVDLADSKTSGTTIALEATQGKVIASRGVIAASDTLSITANAGATQTLVNEGGTLSARQLQINVSNIANTQGGEIVQTGTGATTFAVSGVIDNTAGRIASNGQDLGLLASVITNTGGKIEHAGAGALNIDTGRYVGTGGLLVSNGALALDAGSIDQAGGTINAERIAIDTGGLNNRGGQIIQRGTGQARVAATGALDNTYGLIATATGTGASLAVSGASIDNLRGQIASDGDLDTRSAGGLRNDAGSLRAEGSMNVAAAGQITNAMGAIEAAGAAATLSVQAGSLDNTDGRIANAGTGDSSITAGSIVNARAQGGAGTGLIAANGNLKLQAATLENKTGALVSAGGALDLAVSSTLTNRSQIASDGALTFDQGTARLDNAGGEISASGAMRIAVRDVVNDAGRIVTTNGSGADLSVAAQSFSNQAGTLASDRDLQLVLPGNYTNDSTLHAGRDLTLTLGGTLGNTGTLEAVGTLKVSAASIVNAAGARIQANAVDLHATGAINNAGEITGSTVKIGADSLTNSGAITGGDVSVTARTVSNIGSQALIAATGDVSLWVGDSLNNVDGATIYSGRDIYIGANSALNADGYLANPSTTVVNRAATIEAVRNIDIAAQSPLNERPGVAIEQVQSLDETHTLAMPSWWHNDDNNKGWYNPAAGNYVPYEVYYVNPADILESSTFVTPDGYAVTRVVIKTHANDTAFFSARAGRDGAYGHRERITMTDGTRVLYALGRQDGAANPDQVPGITSGVWQGENDVRTWDAPAPAFDASYGNCSVNCVRFYTEPGYTDPNSIIIRSTQVARGPYTSLSELTRTAHTTAVDDRLAVGAGGKGRIVAGGDIRIGFTGSLTNQYSDIMAGGQLKLQGAPGSAATNVATTLYRRYAFEGVRHYADGVDVNYARPEISTEIGSVSGVMSGSQGVSITGGTIRNVDTSTGTAANIVASVQLTSGGVAGSGGASNASGGSGASHAGTVGAVSAGGQPLPSGGLFTARPDPTSRYLFETRGEFTDYRTWASSDFFFTALGIDPNHLQKRLGDGFYEQKLIREQIAELTGRRYLSGYGDDDAQYLALMTAGTTFADQYDLRPGVALTPEQMKALTSDIVWFETQTVTLPDGSTQEVLVPKVYLAEVGANALKPNGALITGDTVYIEGDSVVNRGGTIGGKGTERAVLVASADIVNQGGTLSAGQLGLQAGGSIRNETLTLTQGWSQSDGRVTGSGSNTSLSNVGRIEATDKLQIKAGGDFVDTAGRISSGGSASIQAGGDVRFDTVETGSSFQANTGSSSMQREAGQSQVGALSTGGDLSVGAGRDLILNGTQVDAGGNIALSAGRDLSIEAVSSSSSSDQRSDPAGTKFRQTRGETTVQGASVKAGGNLTATAGTSEPGDLRVIGSALDATGNTTLGASRDVVLGAAYEAKDSDDYTHSTSGNMFSKRSSTERDAVSATTVVGSSIGGANISVGAGNDIIAQAATLSSDGVVSLSAVRDVTLTTADQRITESHFRENKKTATGLGKITGLALGPETVGAKLLSSNAAMDANAVTRTEAIGTLISAGSVQVVSGGNTLVHGSTIVADNDVTMLAAGNLTIESAQDTTKGSSQSASSKSGMIGTTFNPSFGNVKQTESGQGDGVTQSASQVASLKGDVTLVAGGTYTQTASSVLAAGMAGPLVGGDVNILAKDVVINEAFDTGSSATQSKSSSTVVGGSASVGGMSTDSLRGAASTLSAIGNTGDGRMQALGAVNLALQGKQVADTATAIAAGGGVGYKVSVNVSRNKSESQSTTHASQAVGSSVVGANNVNIIATGGGEASNIHATGANIMAGNTTNLAADNAITLDASKNTWEQHGTNSSSGASIGVGFAGGSQNGFTIELGVSKGKGKEDGSDVSYNNTHVSGGSGVNIASGGDLTMRGAVIEAPRVTAGVGGNLVIESLQDTSEQVSKQSSSGLSVSLCIPPICYGSSTLSASAAGAKANGSYASVTEQSGIKAGDGGFDVNVKGSTDLKGGVISSTQAAIDAGMNTFSTASLTTSDIENHSNYSASGYSISGSVSGALGDQSTASTDKDRAAAAAANDAKPSGGAGVGSASGSQTSTTRAGISGIAGDTTVRTGDDSSAGALTKLWDTTALIQNVQGQAQITQEFGQRAASAWGGYSNGRLTDAIERQDEDAIACWSDGGACRVAGHAFVGGLAGGVAGAAGAGAGASVVEHIGKVVSGAGLTGPMADAVIAGLATAVGYAVSGTTGASGAFNEVTNNYLSSSQVREMRDRLRQAESQNDKDLILAEYSTLSARQSSAILGCAADVCQTLAAEAREGKKTLDSMRTEIAELAGDSGKGEIKNLLNIQTVDRQFFISLNYGWIDSEGNPIDLFEQTRSGGKKMADNVSTGAAYAAAGCAALVACAPAVPAISAVGFAAGIAKDLIFDNNLRSFGADLGVDKVLEKIGSFLKIPALITTPIAEGIKNSEELEGLKK